MKEQENVEDSGNLRESDEQNPETKEESPEVIGYGKPPKKYKFTSHNQPDRKKAAETRKKKQDLREAMRTLMSMQFEFPANSTLAAGLRQMYGKVLPKKMPIMQWIALQQANKALLKADTRAAEFCANHTMGMPKQQYELIPDETSELREKSDEELANMLKEVLDKMK